MPTVVWIGLAVLVLALVAGTALVVVRALEAWRAFRHLQAGAEAAASSLLEAVAQVEERTTALQQGGPKVERSLDRLRASAAMLQIELRVLQDARAPLMRFRAAAVPRK
jgi:phage shock protein A